jgi:c-di-GMP-binding flagellar brake protein YcgR
MAGKKIMRDSQRRKHLRIDIELKVKYRFVGEDPKNVTNKVYEGQTVNIGGGGMMVSGQIPGPEYITRLLMEEVMLVMSLELPDQKEHVKFIARTSWIEHLDEEKGTCSLGIRFVEITKTDSDRIVSCIIKSQAP